MKLGKFVSPFAAYGYEKDKNNKNKINIDIEASKNIKTIFNLYLEGYGYKKIADILNENNIPPPSIYKRNKNIKLNITTRNLKNIKWNSNTIKTILTNEIYIGNLIQEKRTTISYKNHKTKLKSKEEWIKRINTHKPIIKNDIFIKVQNEIKKRSTKKYKAKTLHNLSHLVYCSKCNSLMRKKSSGKHNYLVCTNSEIKKCNNKSIRYDKLESILLNNINIYLKDLYDLNILKEIDNNKLEDELNVKKNNIKIEIEKLNNKITEIDNYIKNLYEDKVKKIIIKEVFKNLLTKYIKEKELHNKELNNLITENSKLIYISLNDIFNKYKTIDKLDRTIVKTLIKKIEIEKDEDNIRIIKIYWNF